MELEEIKIKATEIATKWYNSSNSKSYDFWRECYESAVEMAKWCNTAYGYKWSTENFISNKKPAKKKVVKYDEHGNIIKEFNSIADAAKSIGKAPNTLSTAISINRLCNGYYWKLK